MKGDLCCGCNGCAAGGPPKGGDCWSDAAGGPPKGGDCWTGAAGRAKSEPGCNGGGGLPGNGRAPGGGACGPRIDDGTGPSPSGGPAEADGGGAREIWRLEKEAGRVEAGPPGLGAGVGFCGVKGGGGLDMGGDGGGGGDGENNR